MPLPENVAAASATTPYRNTSLKLDTPTFNAARGSWHYQRSADEIAAGTRAAAGVNRDVELIPGFAWGLKSLQGAWENAAVQETADYWLDASGVNVNGSLVTTYYGQREPDDLPGITPIPGRAPQATPVFIPAVPAGSLWNWELPLDALAFTSPPVPTTTSRELIRTLVSKATFPANQEWVFLFWIPPGLQSINGTYIFIFGGPADVATLGSNNNFGTWAVSLGIDGYATLFEKIAGTGASQDDWAQRHQFRYSSDTRSHGGWHWLYVLPHGRRRLIFRTFQASGQPDGGGPLALQRLAARREAVNVSVYTHNAMVTGHAFQRTICGAGNVRVDTSPEFRFQFGIAQGRYATVGTLVDLPFTLRQIVPTGTGMKIVAQWDLPTGTDITASMYDAQTHALLATDGAGTWYTANNQINYYVKFQLTGDGSATPLLHGYLIEIQPSLVLSEPTVVETTDQILDIDINGPSEDPSHENGTLVLDDRTGALAMLGQRSRIPCELWTTYTNTGLRTKLFEGEIARATALRKTSLATEGALGGGAARVYPASDWAEYECLIIGRWAQLFEKVATSRERFAHDFLAAINPVTGELPGWKVSEIIRFLFNKCGVPDSQLDLPADELRITPSDDPNDFVLQGANYYAPAIQRFARLYLDWLVFYDPNAGVDGPSGYTGMWRAKYAPRYPYINLLQTFVMEPDQANALPHHPGAYTSGRTFVRHGTFRKFTQAPEGNLVVVMGLGERLSDGKQMVLQNYPLQNQASYSADPALPTADNTSVDYLGREVPILYIDPHLNTQAVVDRVARRIFEQACRGRVVMQFQAPLVLVTDNEDTLQQRPRPLRIGDLVRVVDDGIGYDCMVQQVGFNIRQDLHQFADYRVVVLR